MMPSPSSEERIEDLSIDEGDGTGGERGGQRVVERREEWDGGVVARCRGWRCGVHWC